MQTFQLFFIEFLTALGEVFEIFGKPVTELIHIIKQGRHNEVQQSPQLREVVLIPAFPSSKPFRIPEWAFLLIGFDFDS